MKLDDSVNIFLSGRHAFNPINNVPLDHFNRAKSGEISKGNSKKKLGENIMVECSSSESE
jgi:hypothetical protein